MKLKSSLINLKSKLSRSCNKVISFFHDRFRNVNTTQSSSSSSSSFTLFSRLCFLNSSNDQRMNQIRPRDSPSIDDQDLLDSRKRFPLSLMQMNKKPKTSRQREEDVVKEACRSFEDYMIHIIVEEGKIDDLMDMEEILYYWNNLKDPIFIDLVTRFYGELCIDLFPCDHDN